MRFDSVYSKALLFLKEGPVELEDIGPALATAKEIKDKKLPTSWPKPLVQIDSDEDRKEAVVQVMKLVFGDQGVNNSIHDKKALQAALKDAIMDYSSKPGSKFKRPVSNTFAGFLGNWLGTNIKTKITPEGTAIAAKTAEAAVPSEDALSKAFDDAISAKNKTASDAAKELKQAAGTTEVVPNKEESSGGEATDVNPDTEYELAESALASFEQAVEKLNKRAARYGIPPTKIVKVKERFGEFKLKDGNTRTLKLVTIKLEMPAPKLPGDWKFIARVDHESFGNVIVRAPGTDEFEGELHRMYGASQPSGCDHCNRQRNRSNTFIVQDSSGKLKRVGRACLKDYVPGGASSAQKLIAWAEFYTNVLKGIAEFGGVGGDDEGGGETFGGSRDEGYMKIPDILALGMFITDRFGYLSSTNARNNSLNNSGPVESTVDKVRKLLDGDFTPEQRKEPLYVAWHDEWNKDESLRNSYEEKAKEILKWAPEFVDKQLSDPNNRMKDYFTNLKLIVDAANKEGSDYVKSKHYSFVLSLIPMHKRATEGGKENKKADKKPSEYVGTIGLPIGTLTAADKRKIKSSGKDINIEQFPYNGSIKLKVTSTRTFATQGFGYYQSESVAHMTSFEDQNGAVYVWIATYDPDFKEGQEVTLERATVKNHKDYVNKKTGNVTKQTIIKRPKFEGQAEVE